MLHVVAKLHVDARARRSQIVEMREWLVDEIVELRYLPPVPLGEVRATDTPRPRCPDLEERQISGTLTNANDQQWAKNHVMDSSCPASLIVAEYFVPANEAKKCRVHGAHELVPLKA
jgi:hypothetical protein